MHVISPERYQTQRKHHKRRPLWLIPVVLLLVAALANYLRPLPSATASVSLTLPTTPKPTLAWPSYGQQAVTAEGYDWLATNGTQTPLATASIAKVILALCVLQKQPMQLGSSGPPYMVDSNDTALYQTYSDEGGSVVPVVEGETLTEYQMLEALMIPSANNIADGLATKVFGNQAEYATYANAYLLQHDLTQTHIGSDASGYDPSTTSTASDLAQLGLLALKNPVLMSIARQTSVSLPVAGTVGNYNTVLGVNGISGLKTGNNDANPGAFLFTATTRVGTKDILLAGAVMGAPDLDTALQDSTTLVASAQSGFEQANVSQSGQVVGTLHTAWGASSQIVTTSPLQLIRWKATPLTEKHTLHTAVRSGQIGTMQVAAGQAKTVSDLTLEHAISGPSFWWRLTRH